MRRSAMHTCWGIQSSTGLRCLLTAARQLATVSYVLIVYNQCFGQTENETSKHVPQRSYCLFVFTACFRGIVSPKRKIWFLIRMSVGSLYRYNRLINHWSEQRRHFTDKKYASDDNWISPAVHQTEVILLANDHPALRAPIVTSLCLLSWFLFCG